MTTTQKITYLRQFETLLNMMDEQGTFPIGIVAIHETNDKLMGFSPMFIGKDKPLSNKEYGYMLNHLGFNMITSEPESEHHKVVNHKDQNLN